jgi:adenosylcobinamide-phosphate synthase
MAIELIGLLAPNPLALAIGVILDLAVGDPSYRWHPVRLIGGTLVTVERLLRRYGADGSGGGVMLFIVLALIWTGGLSGAVLVAAIIDERLGWLVHVFIVYSLLALGDLIRHVWHVDQAVGRGDVSEARAAIGRLVGRDTEPMDAAACRRAAIESLSENLTDGFVSPVFWYVLGGLPGLVLFKVVSTMDSMIGYKTPEYLRFGWFGARLDDVMNYVPARITWMLIAAVAALLPRCSARKALVVGLEQHAVLPGPNSGWSEAATAGALQRRLVGPIWMQRHLVTETWVGDAGDAAAGSHDDVVRAIALITTTGIASSALAIGALIVITSSLP